MALIALAADKGSPGVTTTAVALAALWPRRALLVEVDPAGGDLVYRQSNADGRPLDPGTGILSLAATARRGIAAEQLWDHSQRLAGGLDVIVGLASSEQGAGVSGQWEALGRAFGELAGSPHQDAAADVIADCGRIGSDSPTLALLPHAALLLLVTRAQPENLAHVRERALALSAKLHGRQRGASQLGKPQIGLVLVTDPQQGSRVAGQVNDMMAASHVGVRIAGLIADDPAGAEQLAGRRRGRLDRSLLVRSARRVVTDLHQTYRGELSPSGAGHTGAHPVPPPAQQPPPGAAGPIAPSVPPQYGQPAPGAPVPPDSLPGHPAAGYPGTPGGPPAQHAANARPQPSPAPPPHPHPSQAQPPQAYPSPAPPPQAQRPGSAGTDPGLGGAR